MSQSSMGPAIAIVASVLAACTGSDAGDPLCVSLSDCRVGFQCIDGICLASTSPGDGSGNFVRVDSGQADAGRRDAGRPLPGDSGTDAGLLDSGAPLASDSGTPDVDAGCLSCLELGAECGPIVDSCGQTVECGECQTGYSCGTAPPFQNRCRCEPRSCQPGVCGSVDNGCGVPLNCTCSSNQVCRSGSCCSPRTSCGNECGTISDGCGGTLSCGTLRTRTTEWRSATSASSPTWTGTGDALTRNDFGALASIRSSGGCQPGSPRVTLASGILQTGDYGFSIPGNATINGIEVELPLTSNHDGSWEIETLQLTTGSTASSSQPDRIVSVPDNFYRVFFSGGANDTWGRQWTPAEINRTSFTARIDVKNTVSCTGFEEKRLGLDSMRLRVTYAQCE